MKRLALFTFLFTTAVSSGTARADDREDQINQLKNKLSEFISAVAKIEKQEEGLSGGAGYFTKPVSECTAIVDELKALGVGPTEVMHHMTGQWPFKRALEKCERYGKVQVLTTTFEAIDKAQGVANIINGMKPGDTGTTMWSGEAAIRGKACIDAINTAETAGAVMDVVLRGTSPEMTAAQTRTWCEDLIKRGAALEGESADADAAKKKKAHDNRYAKVGASGDKLEWLIYYDQDGEGFTWYLPPTCKAVDDPKTLAKAKVLIQWWENPDGTQRLRKLTFKGNKKVKDVEREFLTKSKAYSFCK